MAEKIRFEKIEEIMNDYFPVTDIVEWHGVEIEVLKTIPFSMASEIVVRTANACFTEDGEYVPEIMDVALRLYVINAYTNLELPEDNPEWQNRLMYGTDLWDKVTAVISDDQLDMMMLSINRRIKARLDTNKAEFERGVRQVLDGMAQLADQMNGLFDGVSNDDLKKMILAIGENGIDEAKIVDAVVSAQNKKLDNVVAFPAAEDGANGE